MIKINIIFAIFLVLVGSSCSKESQKAVETFDEFSFIEEFNRVRRTKTNGGLLRIQNIAANYGTNPNVDIITSVVVNVTNELLSDKVGVKINEYGLDINKNRVYEKFQGNEEQFYGKKVLFSFESRESSERNEETYGPYYIPEIISINIPELNSQKVLRDNALITWNADPLNENGVYIVVQYTAFENLHLKDEHPERQFEFEIVEDNGSYIFKKSDFPLIPDDALVIVKAIRGIYDFIDIENFSGEFEEDLLFVAHTESSGYAKYK